MKYIRYSRFWRIVILLLTVFCLIGFGFSCVIFVISLLQESDIDFFPVLILTTVIGCTVACVVYAWFHIITEAEWNGSFLTFTYLTGKKETVSANDIVHVSVGRRRYILKTRRKTYTVTLNFHYSFMGYDEIPFLRQKNFPNAFFERNWP